jgi:hypothetical protein
MADQKPGAHAFAGCPVGDKAPFNERYNYNNARV